MKSVKEKMANNCLIFLLLLKFVTLFLAMDFDTIPTSDTQTPGSNPAGRRENWKINFERVGDVIGLSENCMEVHRK